MHIVLHSSQPRAYKFVQYWSLHASTVLLALVWWVEGLQDLSVFRGGRGVKIGEGFYWATLI